MRFLKLKLRRAKISKSCSSTNFFSEKCINYAQVVLVDPLTALVYVVLGVVLGCIGQLIRVVVGMKKQLDKDPNWNNWFKPSQLAVTILLAMAIGAIAGVLSVLSASSLGPTITRSFMLSIIGAGYSGTDFIEGMMTTAK